MAMDLPREIALKILYDINEKGAYSNIALSRELSDGVVRPLDRAFITEMVYGVLKWKLTIDWIISRFSSLKMKKISPWILNIMRLGVYQIIYMDKVPDSAACNESVNLSKRYGHAGSSKYVNGVLRNISRNKDNIPYPDKKSEAVKYLSVKHSHPEWLVEIWIKRFGPAFTEELLINNNQIPDFTIRTNVLKTDPQKLMEELQAKGLKVLKGRYLDEALIIENPSAFTSLDAYKNGHFQVQDESSMLAARILDPRSGELVIDVCSAPGGKTTHIAELMKNKGVVIARDVHEHKIVLINEAAKRLGIDIIKAEIFDASKLDEKYIGKADRVLVDAPCTGLGIIRKKPDIKWTRKAEDKKEITALQKVILKNAAMYIKTGGVIVYSTCTIEKEENIDIIEDFLKNNKDFELDNIQGCVPEGLREYIRNGYIELYPNINRIDGFFIARMIRKG